MRVIFPMAKLGLGRVGVEPMVAGVGSKEMSETEREREALG